MCAEESRKSTLTCIIRRYLNQKLYFLLVLFLFFFVLLSSYNNPFKVFSSGCNKSYHNKAIKIHHFVIIKDTVVKMVLSTKHSQQMLL